MIKAKKISVTYKSVIIVKGVCVPYTYGMKYAYGPEHFVIKLIGMREYKVAIKPISNIIICILESQTI